MRSWFVLVIALAVLITSEAYAWNALGHKVVAEIAWRQLEPTKREQIVEVLRRHPRFDPDFAAKMTDDVLAGDKAVEDRWIFQHAATWPDMARGLPKGERGKYDRPTWHYINFPLFLDVGDRRALAGKLNVNVATDYRVAKDKGDLNVLQAIAYSHAILASDAGADVKALAYCWLFHLIGDLHQPLHSSALFSVYQFPEGDRGGNSIPLVRGSNLHSLWDNLLGRQHFMRNVDKAVYGLSDRERFGDVWQSAGKATDPRKWAQESHELCESFVYDDAILNAVRSTPAGAEVSKIELPEAYYKAAGEMARKRIVAAGLRLGALLQEVDTRKRPRETRQLSPLSN